MGRREETRDKWIEWGGPEPPAATEQNSAAATGTEAEPELVTVPNAVAAYIKVKSGQQDVGEDRLTDIKVLVELRLIPFAEERNIVYIQQMDKAEIWADFKARWTNLNPLRNRKPEPGQQIPKDVPLGRNTVSKHVGTLREFLRFCNSREWLSDNWASRDHGMRTTKVTEPKEPFSDTELEYIYRATMLKTDGHGWKKKRTGQENAWLILVFIWVLRYTGLRISDVVQPEITHLVPFNAHGYTHALWFHPKKTKEKKAINFVHLPIHSENLPGHPNLVKALQELPLKQGCYFFLGGDGKLKTNVNSWRKRVDSIFKLAEKLMEEDGLTVRDRTHFYEHPHPHKFRHTFAATLLKAGVPTRIVAHCLGDTEEIVRKHYAKFCMADQKAAAGVLADTWKQAANHSGMQFKNIHDRYGKQHYGPRHARGGGQLSRSAVQQRNSVYTCDAYWRLFSFRSRSPDHPATAARRTGSPPPPVLDRSAGS